MQSNNPYAPNQKDDAHVVVGGPQVIQPTGPVATDMQADTVPAPQAHVQSTQTQPVSSTKGQFMGKGGVVRGVFVAALVLIIFAAGFAVNSGVVALNSSNAKSAGKSMVAALVAGNSSKAYGLASANLRSQQTAAALLQSVGDIQSSKATYSDENVQVNGNTAVYVANVSNLPADDSGDTSGIFVVSMTKHGVSDWKVDNVSVQ